MTNNGYEIGSDKNVLKVALPGAAQWIECWLVDLTVDSSIPSQSTWLGCELGPQLGV